MRVIFAVLALFTTSLNSGSNGNCYYIGNETEAVLIDAGISCRETEKRMKLLGLKMKNVKAIFISHEHTDHIKGVASIYEKFAIPLYITDSTLRGCHAFTRYSPRQLLSNVPVTVGGLTVTPFPKMHDAQDPHSFLVSGNGVTIGVFTDIGKPCVQVQKNFQLCHAAYLEANYDKGLLETGNYPHFLKKRIMGDKGHLSNDQALEVFLKYKSPFISHLFLSHLSKDNNCPVKVKSLFENNAGDARIIVASRYVQSDVYFIQERAVNLSVPFRKAKQMTLF